VEAAWQGGSRRRVRGGAHPDSTAKGDGTRIAKIRSPEIRRPEGNPKPEIRDPDWLPCLLRWPRGMELPAAQILSAEPMPESPRIPLDFGASDFGASGSVPAGPRPTRSCSPGGGAVGVRPLLDYLAWWRVSQITAKRPAKSSGRSASQRVTSSGANQAPRSISSGSSLKGPWASHR
jgi:hypothetical protein